MRIAPTWDFAVDNWSAFAAAQFAPSAQGESCGGQAPTGTAVRLRSIKGGLLSTLCGLTAPAQLGTLRFPTGGKSLPPCVRIEIVDAIAGTTRQSGGITTDGKNAPCEEQIS